MNKKISIEESNMIFGPYDKEQFFHIENSYIYKNLGKNVKITEFILLKQVNSEKKMYIIEAKSSAPNPGNNKSENFDKYIDEISEKLLNSLLLTVATFFERHKDNYYEFPDEFKKVYNYSLKTILLLVINNHKIEWLDPISIALNIKMRNVSRTWPLKVAVINDSIAREKGFIT